MFDKLKRKPKVQVSKPDVIVERIELLPKHIVPEERAERWKKLKYEAKDEVLTFLNTLDRVDLMRFQDAKQFDGTDCEDAVWETSSDAEWARDYPMGEYEYTERIPSIVKETMKSHDIDELNEKVDGMQKKLDKITTLISNAEFKLCGKDALKL